MGRAATDDQTFYDEKTECSPSPNREGEFLFARAITAMA